MIGRKDKRNGQNVFPRFFLIFISAALLSLTFQTYCFATTVSLQWAPSAGATGYKVHYQADSSSQPFQETMDVENQTTATISGLDPAHPHYFAVTAYNAAGESSYSNVVSVPELVAPSASITYPSANATVSGTVSVNASASDNVGVTKVEFYVNGSLKATDTSTPYLYSWNTSSLTAGTYTLMAKAYDSAGNVGPSAGVSVNVVIPDITTPTVSLTAPANNATLSGNVTISASASDNVGVDRVEFYENSTLLTATDVTPYSYNWNTTSVANGSYTIHAKAYDASGNFKQSSSVSVTVKNPDIVLPVVSLTAPANSSTVSGSVSITANASDNTGVKKVEFYVNDVLKGTDSASPYSYSWSTTSLPNDDYVIYAKAYDAAGNIKSSSSVLVTVNNPDKTVPTVSITSPASSSKVSGTVTITASASDLNGINRVEFYVDGNKKDSSTSSPYKCEWDTTGVTGSHIIYAKAYDAANNVKQSVSVSVTVDNAAPTAVSITAPASDAKLKGTVTIIASAKDNVGVSKVEFFVDDVLMSTDTAYPFSYGWNSKTVTDGDHNIHVKAYDAAGNSTKSSTVTVSVDNTLPSVSITHPATGTKVGGTVTVTGEASDNAGLSKIVLYIGGALKGTFTASPFSYSWNTKAIANGAYKIFAKAYDTAGNITQSPTVSVTVDNTAPTVSITAPAANAKVGGSSVTIKAGAKDNVGVTNVEFYVDGSKIGSSASSPFSCSWDTTTFPEGGRTIYAKAFDAAGNVKQSASISVTVDNTKPTVSLTAPADGSTVKGTVSITADATDNIGVTKVEFYVNGVLKGADTTSPYRCSWYTTSVPNGGYTIYAKAYDAAGNVTQSASAGITVNNPDATAPTVSISSPKSSSKVKGTVIITANATDFNGVTKVDFYINGVYKGIGTVSGSKYSYDWVTESNGLHTIYAKAYDAANNVRQSASVSVTVDNTVPTVSLTAPAAGAKVKGTVTITASATDNLGVSKVEFYVDDVLKATDTASPFTYSLNTTTISDGIHNIHARAYDAAGNSTQSPTVAVTADNTAPTTVSITSPVAGTKITASSVYIRAAASDNTGGVGISRVDFYVNGVLKGSDTSSPYGYTWTTGANGKYTIFAKAYDRAGNVKQSASVSVTVSK